MTGGSRRALCGATAVAVLCLLIGIKAAGQAPAPQGAPEKVPMTDDVFKSVEILKGIPVDTFFETMGMFASAMGNDCTFCHVSNAYFDKTAFAEPTPRIRRARQMLTMTKALNDQYFAGRTRVTCFTCHGGSQAPRSEPDLALQYGAPTEDPNARDFPVDPRVSADEIFDKYLQALGGADRLAKLTSYVAKGSYSGFDTAFERSRWSSCQAPISDHDRPAGRWHQASDVRRRKRLDCGTGHALPILTLPRATWIARGSRRSSVSTADPAGVPEVARRGTAIDDREVRVVAGIGDSAGSRQFLISTTPACWCGLVRWTRTPVGFVPTQWDYSITGDVAGVKIPFHRAGARLLQMNVDDRRAAERLDRRDKIREAPCRCRVRRREVKRDAPTKDSRAGWAPSHSRECFV